MTGAARGLGRAIAERLARGNASIVIGDVDEPLSRQSAEELRRKGMDAVAVNVDISDEASVAAAYAAIDSAFGRLDILVNNAGVLGLDNGERPQVATMPLALWQRTIDVNLTGTFLMCRGAVSLMQRNGWGRIVNLSSRVGRTRTGPGNAHYAASKAALIGWSESLRLELVQADHTNVRVTTVTPSYISTGMFAGARGPVLAPILEPEYVVDKVWRAMLAGRPLVQLPWSVGLSRALRGLLPTKVFDRVVGDGFGVYRSMERFTGR